MITKQHNYVYQISYIKQEDVLPYILYSLIGMHPHSLVEYIHSTTRSFFNCFLFCLLLNVMRRRIVRILNFADCRLLT